MTEGEKEPTDDLVGHLRKFEREVHLLLQVRNTVQNVKNLGGPNGEKMTPEPLAALLNSTRRYQPPRWRRSMPEA